MIIIGNKKVRVINPKQIVHLELVKGKTSVYVKGDNDGDIITVKNLAIREPWTVVVKTTIDTHYVNQKSFDDALEALIVLALKIDETVDQQSLEGKLRKIYGQEKEKKSK